MSYPGGPPRGYPPPAYNAAPAYGPPGSQPPPATGAMPAAPQTYRPPGVGGPAFMNPGGGPAVMTPPASAAPTGYGMNANMMPPPPAAGPPGAATNNAPPAGYGLYGAPAAAPPAPTGYGAPPAPTGYGAPPAPTGYGAPPGPTPATAGFGAPPSMVPATANPTTTSAPPPGRPAFFSMGTGAPVPTAGPGYGGPPTASTAPAGYGGPPTMPPPPTAMNNMNMPPPPVGGPAGAGAGNAAPFMAVAGPPGYGNAPPPQYAMNYGATAAPPSNSMQGMPMGFDSGNNLNAQAGGNLTPGGPNVNAGGAPNNDPNALSNANPLPGIDEIDMSITCNPNFLRTSVTKIVASQQLASNCRLPLGVVCKPMAGDKGTSNEEVEVVDFGATGIVRCKRCRTYINPFVSWTDNGRRWRCNICGMLNDVPSTYFSHLDQKGQRRDKDQRPELSRCSVEFVAPGDYMVRPPQPPVYFFVIDVSEAAVASGMIRSTVNAIRSALDELPGQPRTQVGFITFDAHIHFYNLKSSLSAPQMLVISDITDPIMPLPEDLLVNLQDSRKVVDALLDALPSMFHKALQPAADAAQPLASMAPSNSCLGSALMAAKRVIQHVGGKLCVFQASLPTLGEGALKMRENPRLLGTDKEHTMLVAEDPWYKTQAIDFSRLQIAVDTFLFSGQYTDVATIAALSKYTSGACHYYPAFFAPRDGVKYEKELYHTLTRATAFEAVMRVRATRGLRFSNFYGNYFIRGTDLLALPNCTSDSTFTLDLAYDEPHLTASVVTIQAALLYTNSTGERRIRVHTMVLPVTNSLPEMIETADIDCAMNLLSKQAVDIAQKSGLDNARQRVNQLTIEMLRGARMAVSGPGAGAMMPNSGYPQPGYNNPMQQQQQQQQQAVGAYANGSTLPNSLLLLPLYAMSLQKSLVLRGGTDVRVDERAFFQISLNNMDIEESKVFIYPRMFSIHDMGHDAGLPCDNVQGEYGEEMVATAGPLHVRLPAILNLSHERLSRAGIVLLENGYDMFMWIGRDVNPAIVSTLFGVPSLEGIPDVSKLAILPDNSDFSSRVNAIVLALRAERARYMQLHFIREGDGYAEAYFARFLIEDRANFSGGGMSYIEYHSHVNRAVG